jgi:adenine-specific DNA-methyltransferase
LIVTDSERIAYAVSAPLADRLDALRILIPEAFAEGGIDFDKLRAALGGDLDNSPERYTFTWAGKREAIQLLQEPSRATLAPALDESVEFDTTQHVFIEGENLETLKLLRKAYAGQVKMIYIDPPYNTGNDFIYPDDFSDPLGRYLEVTGQTDAVGNMLTSNPETSGRYHSAWLSMMYPRLFLARQLLREDGVIFVSIDDHEVHNLRLLMNEIIGEENFVAAFVRRRRMATGIANQPVSQDHECVLTYSRQKESVRLYGSAPKAADYVFEDAKGKYRSTDLTVGMTKRMRPKQCYAIRNPQTGVEYWPPDNRVWRFQPTVMQAAIDSEDIIWPNAGSGRTRPRYKTRLDPASAETHVIPVSTVLETKASPARDHSADVLVAGLNQEATKEVRELLGSQLFEYPKPVSLLRSLIALSAPQDDIVLDFFAGSASTAQAVLEEDAEKRGSLRFMMVQLPERTEPGSAAQEAGYETISAVGQERLRRAISLSEAKAGGELDVMGASEQDLGFRVFKLQPSNFRQWQPVDPDDSDCLVDQMGLFVDPLVDRWQAEDVLWEVAIKEGYALHSRVEQLDDVAQNTVWRVTDPDKQQSFLICLDHEVQEATASGLRLSTDDLFICRDVALTDTLAANLALQCRLKTI